MRLMIFLALRLGRPAARACLYPIVWYFLVFSGPARRGAVRYLGRALGRPPEVRDLFRHYHTLASTILDRVYLLTGQYHRFDVAIHGLETITTRAGRRPGCLLLGSHLGTFEVVRALAVQADVEVKLVMHDDRASILREAFAELNPDLAADVIPAGTPQTMLRVRECLARGGMVGVLGDRVAKAGQVIRCSFLGFPAAFPAGTFRLASLLGVPVILFFGLYRGGNRYEIHLELLAEGIDSAATDRDAQARYWTERYAERLAHYCRLAPYNWFNFYDYWDEEGDVTAFSVRGADRDRGPGRRHVRRQPGLRL